jgi:hypothetical protein
LSICNVESIKNKASMPKSSLRLSMFQT